MEHTAERMYSSALLDVLSQLRHSRRYILLVMEVQKPSYAINIFVRLFDVRNMG
ncbi:MAG: hypothetical protein ACI9BW_001330 [Gammaproteobacteria bacterium]|jgi:hypothetical protein